MRERQYGRALPRWVVPAVIIFLLLVGGLVTWGLKGDQIVQFFSDSLLNTPTLIPENSQTQNPDNDSQVLPADNGATTPTGEQPSLAFIEHLVLSTHELVNDERAILGLDSLRINSQLTSLANEHSEEMTQYDFFSHERMPGFRGLNWEMQPGTFRGENLAKVPQRQYLPGPLLPANEVAAWAVSGWMDSPGHKDNILTPNYMHTGIGVSFSNGYLYITQIFEGNL
jgi:uncharacterized protein YkwD